MATDQIIRYPPIGGPSKYTFSLWAFPVEMYPSVLPKYFEWVRDYYQTTGYRVNMLHVGYWIRKDQQSLFSYSYDGDVMTIDPVSTANSGWTTFLDAYNQYCSDLGRIPLLNQTPRLTRAQAQKALGPRLQKFGAARRTYDPKDRLMNDFFRDSAGGSRCRGAHGLTHSRRTPMLSTPWEQHKTAYDIVIIGSGYGGAITAARLASAALTSKPSICILERGQEWAPGTFPETLGDVVGATRSDVNPLGLYELLNYPDISVIKGSGLGGTSLINANVAILPDREVFEQFGWPSTITYDALQPYYQRAHQMLGANPHPNALQLPKVQALDRRAKEIGMTVKPVDIVVNFAPSGNNAQGVHQEPCNNCGNCVTGCNVRAKNTLYMNYLPMAQQAGATILTQTKVEWIEKRPAGGWTVCGRHVVKGKPDEKFQIDAANVVLSAGSLNSTEILLRSEAHGLSVSPALGTRFNGNGDFFGLAYNGDYETDVLGYPYRQSQAAGDSPMPGPNIVGVLRYDGGLPEAQRIAIEDFSFPNAYRDGAKAIFGAIRGQDTVAGNEDAQRARLLRDLDPHGPRPRSQWRDEPLDALSGDGPGQRSRHDSLRRALVRIRRPHQCLLGPRRAAADLHPHE